MAREETKNPTMKFPGLTLNLFLAGTSNYFVWEDIEP